MKVGEGEIEGFGWIVVFVCGVGEKVDIKGGSGGCNVFGDFGKGRFLLFNEKIVVCN